MERKPGEVGSLPSHEPPGAQAQKGTPSLGDVISLHFRLTVPSLHSQIPATSNLS